MVQSKSCRVGVIFGGRSGEHEVSLASARNVINALQEAGHEVIPLGITPQGRWLISGDPMKRLTHASNPDDTDRNGSAQVEASTPVEPALGKWALLPRASAEEQLPPVDVIFPVLHGPNGEDGTIQGLLEMAGMPYVGCGVLSSAVAMDKDIAKRLFAVAGIRQTAYRVVMRSAWQRQATAILEQLESQLAYPLFVKPANLGSSVGISKARTRHELSTAIDLACEYDRKVVIEEAVPHAREIEISVLGNDDPMVSVPGEIVPGNEFYDYTAKYISDSSDLIIPAPLTEAQTNEVQTMALEAFRAVEGSGLARVDFLLDDESGALYLNEINTMPGFTCISMYPKLWEASGVSYSVLVDRLVQAAFERYDDRQRNRMTR